MEAMRTPPATPQALYRYPEIPVRYATVDGMRIRFVRTGQGPGLVLLHTLRTQLDIFQKIIPRLARTFTVHALDYPGHGFSDIPKTDYRPELFVNTVEGFLDQMDIRDATLAGISVGGTIPLLSTARRNPRVKKVLAINPYDYDQGAGILAKVPVLGETVMRFRNPLIEATVMEGGVAGAGALPKEFLAQVF
jgi:pimeloyl-ACP methyl ester carboxylesterase